MKGSITAIEEIIKDNYETKWCYRVTVLTDELPILNIGKCEVKNETNKR